MNQNILACSRTLKNVYLVLSKYPVHFKLVMFRNQIKATEWFLKNISKIQRISKPLHFSMQLNKKWIKSNLKCSKFLCESRHNRLQYKEVEWGALKSPEAKKSSSFDREELVGWLWLWSVNFGYSSVPNKRACTIINFGGKSPTYMTLFGPTHLLILRNFSNLHVYSILQAY